MSSFVKILLHVPDSATTMSSVLNLDTNKTSISLQAVEELMSAVVNGSQVAYAKISTGAVQATGSFAVSSFVADDTITINGRVYTGKSNPSGLQQFKIGDDDSGTAANAAVVINADTSALVAGVVTASSSTTTLTITAVQPGLTGNAVVLANSAHATPTAMTGGSDGSQIAINFGAAS